MRRWSEFVSRSALAGALFVGLMGCGRSGGSFVWVEDVPAPRDIGAYTIAVMGEVVHAGMYTLTPGAGVAEALASAGGLTEFAHRDRIFVVRRTPELLRIRFSSDTKALPEAAPARDSRAS